MYDAIAASNAQGILFVAAAGNEGWYNDYGSGFFASPYPATYDLEGIISVAATTDTDQLAWFSNFGPVSVDLAAPGFSTALSEKGLPQRLSVRDTTHVRVIVPEYRAVGLEAFEQVRSLQGGQSRSKGLTPQL